MEDRKELTKVPGLPEEEVVVIKKLGFGSLGLLRSRSTIAEVDVKSGAINASLDLGKYTKWIVVFGVHKAKFFENCRNYEDRGRSIDNDVISSVTGQYLFNEIQKLNGFGEIEELKKKSHESSKKEVEETQ